MTAPNPDRVAALMRLARDHRKSVWYVVTSEMSRAAAHATEGSPSFTVARTWGTEPLAAEAEAIATEVAKVYRDEPWTWRVVREGMTVTVTVTREPLAPAGETR